MIIEQIRECIKQKKDLLEYYDNDPSVSDDIAILRIKEIETELAELEGLICDCCENGKVAGRVTLNMISPPEDVNCPVCHGTGVK